MLELPVAMQYKINRSRILPLFLEGGLSVSRLMGANALFYDPTTGLYLKSGNVLNKTQLDLSSSLLIGLPFRGIRIQAGPQVQYGLTPLINSQGPRRSAFLIYRHPFGRFAGEEMINLLSGSADCDVVLPTWYV